MQTLNATPAQLYLKLLRHCLCRDIFPDSRYDMMSGSLRLMPFDPAMRDEGRDWPLEAVTMVGAKRLANLEGCCSAVLGEGIAGDFVETGVWRGGCRILMRAVLAAAGDDTRKVWLFDSFQGLPKPDVKNYPEDEPDRLWTFNSFLGVSLAEVKANFAKFDMLDDRTQFVAGWFRDTIPRAEVDSISVLRLDGDLYESTWLVLTHFYPKLAPRGFVIIDDLLCKRAKRRWTIFARRIQSPITTIDWGSLFWRK